MTFLCTLVFGFIIFAGVASAQDGYIGNVADLRALSQADAARGLPVRMEATVLIYDFRSKFRSEFHEFVVHDGKAGIFVKYNGPVLGLQTGEKVELRGRSERGLFAPILNAESVTRIGEGQLPAARAVTMKDILSGREDCQWVEIEGVVRRYTVVDERLALVLDMEGQRVPASFTAVSSAVPQLAQLVESRVALRGTVTGRFNEQGQMTGVRNFFSPGPAYLRVLHTAPDDAFSRVATPLLDVRERAADLPPTQRIKVAGVVTHHAPGGTVFIADGTSALMLRGDISAPLSVGDAVEAVGFREQGKGSAFLEDSMVHRTGKAPPPAPREITAAAAASGTYEAELVSLQAHFAERVSDGEGEALLFYAGSTRFTVRPHGPVSTLRAGEAVRLTGVCTVELPAAATGGHAWQGAFHILLRSAADVRPLSPWTRERLLALAGGVAAVFAGAMLWIVALRRRVDAQTALIREKVEETAALAERNRIARELHDTLAQGFAGTAFALEGIASNLPADEEYLRPQLDMALRMVRHSLSEARRSVMNLRADALEGRDLAAAINETARKLADEHGVELRTDFQPLTRPLPAHIENDVFRIAIEAVTNALRHGKPRLIGITWNETADRVLLLVSDDGAGFDAAVAPASGHFGLIGMRERARRICADFTIESAPGRGCEVRLVLAAKTLPTSIS